eukprot:4434369-Amphidinium_carterae.1
MQKWQEKRHRKEVEVEASQGLDELNRAVLSEYHRVEWESKQPVETTMTVSWGTPDDAVRACTDGSAIDPVYRRSAWAVVYLDVAGHIMAEEAGLVGLRQSPQHTVFAQESG